MKIKKIKIVGMGMAGLMFASMLRKKINTINVDIYYNPNIKPLPVGESTQPFVADFFRTIFDSDEEWMNECNAMYKFYVQHHSWNEIDKTWFFPLYHESSEASPFNKEDIFKYNKNYLPSHDRIAWNFQSTLLQPLLTKKCKELGVKFYESDFSNIECLDSEYIIDCRGFKGQNNKTEVSPAIINDFAIAGQIQYNDERYYTKTVANSYGWRWEIPHQDSLGVGLVFNKDYLSIDNAKKLMNKLYGLEEFLEVPFSTSYDKEPCTEKLLKIGTAAVFIEPLESTTLMIINQTCNLFCMLFDQFSHIVNDVFCKSFNFHYNKLIEGQINYVEGFYCMTERRDSEYWKYVSSHEKWYIEKLEDVGWPYFYGEFGLNEFSTAFNCKDKLKNVKVRNYHI